MGDRRDRPPSIRWVANVLLALGVVSAVVVGWLASLDYGAVW